MIIDSSAIIAVINGEPEATPFAHAIAAAVCRISVVNYVEAAIVADNRGEAMRNAFDTLVDEMGLIIEPVTPRQARIAGGRTRSTARATIPRPSSTWATVSPTLSLKTSTSLCSSKARTSHTPTSPLHSADGPEFPLPNRDHQGSSREYRVLL